jgi:DNA polymerase V
MHGINSIPYVSCGFPSPADDYLEAPLSLDKYLVRNPSSTFIVRASGDSMIGAGIFPKDLIVIDRSITAVSGMIILAILNGEFTVKRLIKNPNQTWSLKPENSMYPIIDVPPDSDYQVWGVVTHTIHQCLP